MNGDSKLIFEAYSASSVVVEWSPFAGGGSLETLGYKNKVLTGLDWTWEILKFIEPTGIMSWPDVIEAAATLYKKPDAWNITMFVLSLIAVIPLIKYGGKGLSKGLKLATKEAAAGKSVAAALPEINKGLAEAMEVISAKMPAIEKFATEHITDPKQLGQVKGALGILKTNLGKIKIDEPTLKQVADMLAQKAVKADPSITERLIKKAGTMASKAGSAVKTGVKGTVVRGARVLSNLGIGKSPIDTLRDTSTKPAPEISTLSPAKQKELDLATGKAPLPVPEPAGPTITHALTWDDNGNLVPTRQPLTQRQFNAMGGVGQQRMSTGETLPVMSPANIPQGATQDNRMGREGMSPYQLRRPDNFNRSLNIFGAPQSSYGQPAGGDLVGTLLQPLLGIAGNAGNFSIGAQLSPVNNFAGFAGSLINILPGLGAI